MDLCPAFQHLHQWTKPGKIMKKKTAIQKPAEEKPVNPLTKEDKELRDELSEAISIEEFIKIRKLQNRILEKMLEKINQPDSKKNLKKNK